MTNLSKKDREEKCKFYFKDPCVACAEIRIQKELAREVLNEQNGAGKKAF
jgi:hypothetical protein